MTRPRESRDDDALLALLCLDEQTGPAKRLGRERAQAMVEAALDHLQVAPPKTASAGKPFRALVAAAVVLLAVVGGASAARWHFGRAAQPSPEARPAPPARQAVRAPAAEPPPEPAEAVVESAPEIEPPAPRPHKRPSVRAHQAPSDLLQQANRLRAEGRFREAAEVYARVSARFPGSLSAYAATVAAASLMREHLGRPRRAQMLYRQALRTRPDGALSLEARQGLALAYQDLGEREAEARVLSELARRHPDSPAARRARERLDVLRNRTP